MAAATMLRPLDLEAFLTWAIRDQAADRSDVGLHPTEFVAHYGQLLDLPIGAGVYGRDVSADGCFAIANRHEVGTEIDGSGATRGIPPRVHPDAELVADVIDRLPGLARRLVLSHARRGDRPDWLAPRQPLVAAKRPSDQPGRYRHLLDSWWEPIRTRTEIARARFLAGEPLVGPDGRRRLIEEEKGFRFRLLGDGTRQVMARACRLEPLHSPEEVEEANARYACWHSAMVSVLMDLQDLQLRAHRITTFGAAARPWDKKP